MNLQFFLEKLQGSEEYKGFIKENPDAFLASGFFIIDVENNEKSNKYHLDYYCAWKKGENGKMFSFQLEEGIKLVPLELLDSFKATRIKLDSTTEFKEIEEIILREMKKQGIKNKLQKIIMSLQNINNKNIFICTVFVSMLGLIKVTIDDSNKEITSFEKKSFFDMLKKG